MNLKIYKNEKIINHNKQIKSDPPQKIIMIKNHQKNTIKIMLQYWAMYHKVRHTLHNHAGFAARFSKCSRILQSITQ